MKRLVLCFDGTWNTLADPEAITNVVKIADLIALQDPKGVNQICYYNAGVGSGGPIDRITGGIFGAGLKNNVKRGLAFLTQNYDAGRATAKAADEIYLFGFSRGAYTARAVAGVISTVGIPWEIRNSEEHWEDYRKIAKLMSKQRGLKPGTPKYERLQAEINTIQNEEKKDEDKKKPPSHKPENIKIKCISVFDTVGSYGVPAGLGLSGLPHLFTYWTRGFRSRRIGSKVDVALHAMAIDEMRRPFMPTFWVQQEGDKIGKGQIVEQMWFPGVHCNVGGGYPDKRISDMALAWMISRVKQHTDLEFNEEAIFDGNMAMRRRHRVPNQQASLAGQEPDHHADHRKGERKLGRGKAASAPCQRERALEREGAARLRKGAGGWCGVSEICAAQSQGRELFQADRPRESLVQSEQGLARRQVPAQGGQPAVRMQDAPAALFRRATCGSVRYLAPSGGAGHGARDASSFSGAVLRQAMASALPRVF